MSNLAEDLTSGLKSITKSWKQAKRQADREDRVSQHDLERLRRRAPLYLNIKEAAHEVMEQAYMKASAGGTLPANARQIMYAARPLIMELTGNRCWKNSSYFTQHLLPDFMNDNLTLTADWDVVFDDRGHFVEPHTRNKIGLGTLAVRDYRAGWDGSFESTQSFRLPIEIETKGPENRFRFVVFIEKEGFNPLLQRAQIAERYDLAIMSTKGMSVTAARQLVDWLSAKDVTIFVVRDFDKAGFSIVSTLCEDTRRYSHSGLPNVVDLGLRLDDVKEVGLPGEPVTYGRLDPTYNLEENGATQEECEFLVHDRSYCYGPWSGERVELNAMNSKQFIDWLEKKLQAAGVEKVIPNTDALTRAYRRAVRITNIQRAIDELGDIEDEDIPIPVDLDARVRRALEETPTISWDLAVAQTAET